MQEPSSILFTYAGDAYTKCQMLRWLLQDQRAKSPTERPVVSDVILDILRTALADEDSKVQVTAMLVAGQLDAVPLRSAIDDLKLPSAYKVGLTRTEYQTLVAARTVIVAHLIGVITDANVDHVQTLLPGVPPHFARCVLGLPFDRMDTACQFIISLTTPAPEPPADFEPE